MSLQLTVHRDDGRRVSRELPLGPDDRVTVTLRVTPREAAWFVVTVAISIGSMVAAVALLEIIGLVT